MPVTMKDRVEVGVLVALVALIPLLAVGLWVNESWRDKRRQIAELDEAEREVGCD